MRTLLIKHQAKGEKSVININFFWIHSEAGISLDYLVTEYPDRYPRAGHYWTAGMVGTTVSVDGEKIQPDDQFTKSAFNKFHGSFRCLRTDRLQIQDVQVNEMKMRRSVDSIIQMINR